MVCSCVAPTPQKTLWQPEPSTTNPRDYDRGSGPSNLTNSKMKMEDQIVGSAGPVQMKFEHLRHHSFAHQRARRPECPGFQAAQDVHRRRQAGDRSKTFRWRNMIGATAPTRFSRVQSGHRFLGLPGAPTRPPRDHSRHLCRGRQRGADPFPAPPALF